MQLEHHSIFLSSNLSTLCLPYWCLHLFFVFVSLSVFRLQTFSASSAIQVLILPLSPSTIISVFHWVRLSQLPSSAVRALIRKLESLLPEKSHSELKKPGTIDAHYAPLLEIETFLYSLHLMYVYTIQMTRQKHHLFLNVYIFIKYLTLLSLKFVSQ